MTTEIPKEQWKEFFDNLSRDFDGWGTRIEVFSNDVGAQVLSRGLPFRGSTVETKEGQPKIELLVGHCADCHQSHTVAGPVKVSFEGSGLGPSGILSIEDESGTQVLITFVEPFPILLECISRDVVSAAVGKKD